MKHKSLIFVLFVLALLSGSSCSKLFKATPFDLLTRGPWDGDSYKIYANGSLFQEGDLDATLTFYKDGTYKYEDHENNTTEEGEWELKNDDKEIEFKTDGGDETTAYIDELDKNNLAIHVTESGFKAEYTFTRD